MKKTNLFLIATTVLLLFVILIFSCKKNSTEDSNLTYIKNFYGVNKVHSFVCFNPTNDTKSLQVDLVWDENGKATYKTTDIPRDTTAEHNGRLFMPASEFNVDNAAITPTRPVKTSVLTYINGNFEVVNVPNGGCHPYYTCSCGNVPATAYYENDVFQWWYCYQNQNGACYPNNLVYHNCNGIAEELPMLGWQSE